MAGTEWIVEAVSDNRFPYRLSIRQGDKTLLCLRVQDLWPGAKRQIFCLREEGRDWPPPSGEVERVGLLSFRRFGRRIVVILDRATKKRCDFLFLEKPYKTHDGLYEQIFWRTPLALRERRPRVKLTVFGRPGLEIIVDSGERYAWTFPACLVTRDRLPAGDYALRGPAGLLAVVERKTFENLLAEFGRLAIFHQQLADLEAFARAALVVEAQYADFLKPDKLRFYSPSFAAKALAEIQALHPKVQVVFAGNRKLGREWAGNYFASVAALAADAAPRGIAEAEEAYGEAPIRRGRGAWEVRSAVDAMPGRFSFRVLRDACPGFSDAVIRGALNGLRREGVLTCNGRTWEKRGGLAS